MHGYAEKSCTKLAPFFPGTVLGLTTKIPQSAEFARHVAAGAAPPPRISTRNPNENGSNASPRRSKKEGVVDHDSFQAEAFASAGCFGTINKAISGRPPELPEPSIPRLPKFTKCAQFT